MANNGASSLNKEELLSLLDIDPEKMGKLEDVSSEQMGLAMSLLKIAGITTEREYSLCSSLAKKLLGKVPEPEEINMD